MGLADEIASSVTRRGSEIDRVIAELEGDDLRDFVSALNDPTVSPSAISKALSNRGLLLDQRRISAYRNNGGRVRYGLDGRRVVG